MKLISAYCLLAEGFTSNEDSSDSCDFDPLDELIELTTVSFSCFCVCLSVWVLVGLSICLPLWWAVCCARSVSLDIYWAICCDACFVCVAWSVQICVILASGKRNTSVEFALTPMYLIILMFPVCYRTDCSQCTIQKAAISTISTSEASALDCQGEERCHGGLAEILFAEQATWQMRHRNILSCGTADPNLAEH